ncbi:MAG TPA: hypothetical protein VFX49_17540, partial [Chloroflexota bacterium]|nr:hypothetical protein [Chloroflexota bacterium]
SRERRLRLAGHALAEASTRDAIYAAALSGARELLAGTSHFGVELAIGDGADSHVVGAAGEDAATAHGHQRSHFRVPLVAHGVREGALVVASQAALDEELRDDLETLADLTALAVESQVLLDGTVPTSSTAPAPETVASPFHRARESSSDALRGVSAAHVLPSLWRFPRSLPGRVRWLFLAGGLVGATWVAIASIATAIGGAFNPLQLLAILAPVWLGAWWLYGYRRDDFPLAGDVVVAALLGGAIAGSNSFVVVQPLIIASLWARASHGATRGVAIAVILHAVAFYAAVALSPGRGAGLLGPIAMVVLPLVMVVVAGAVHFLAQTLHRYERALQRERALRLAGSLLVAASDRAHVHIAALDGASALLRETPGAAAVVAVGAARSGQAPVDSDDMEVVAAVGEHAAHARGRAIHLRDLPDSIRETLHRGDPVDLAGADAAVWQALDLEGTPGPVFAVPLHARGALEGAIVVGSEKAVDAELKDDLQTLASLAALALEDVVLAESRG